MAAQLRRYRIKAGEGERFAREWRAHVAPLRESFGFHVHGWLVDDSDEFVWLLEHHDRESFAAADDAYYASAQRQSVDPDPSRLIEEARKDWVRVVF